jgi:hypothetical protein
MKLFTKTFLLLTVAISSISSHAQVIEALKPKTSTLSAKLFRAPEEHVYAFDQVAASDLDKRLDHAGHMPIFARSVPTDISLSGSGTWSMLPDGGRVWRVQVSSPGALALIPCYDRFFIPAGAMLHVYTPDRREMIGAFTAANNPKDGRFNSGLIHGDACILEYYEPASVAGQGRIHLNELGHAYRMVPRSKETQDFGSSESCEVNVKCPEGINWQDQKNAVVRMLVKTGPNYGWCSASLVNNANQDCTPYILSADHCYQDDVTGQVSPAQDLSQWMFYFQYESPTCADPTSEGTLANNFMIGCTFCAASLDTGGNGGSDFVLLRLNSAPPVSYIPYYAGWSNTGAVSDSGVGIHHPAADIKKISSYRTPLVSTSWGGEVSGTHWQILWAPTVSGHGVTEGGSSGSPIFDPQHHIIGTLTGGGSDCTTPNNNDYYGKFAYHWASNGTLSDKRLQNWLDPNNIGLHTLNGAYSPCTATDSLDAAIVLIREDSSFCSANISLTATLSNDGLATLTSDSIALIIDGGTPQYVLWTGSLTTFRSTQVPLPIQNLSTGTHTVTVISYSPDGRVDANTANDTMTTSITIVASSGEYAFYLATGDQGSKITWQLTDTKGNVLYSGGAYTDNPSGETITQSWCLPNGCYTFTIFSGAGDGLSGNSVAGTFNIQDGNGNTVAQIQQVNFGSEESVQVCQPLSLGINSPAADLADIGIYPNPSTGRYYISNAQKATSLTVTDELGRVILTTGMKGQASRQIDLIGEATGVYFFRFTSPDGYAVRKVILTAGE